jgi:hypothetical protein
MSPPPWSCHDAQDPELLKVIERLSETIGAAGSDPLACARAIAEVVCSHMGGAVASHGELYSAWFRFSQAPPPLPPLGSTPTLLHEPAHRIP